MPTFILWIVFWIIILIFAFIPKITDPIAFVFGFGRGLDLLFILGIVGCFYLIFRLYVKIDKLDQNITELVRKLAIENEEKELNSDSEEFTKENNKK